MNVKEEKRKFNRRFSALLTVISLVLFVFTSPKVSIAGDVNISRFIASNIKPGFFFISPALAFPLQFLAGIIPNVNWWLCFSMAAMFISEYIILYYIQEMAQTRHRRAIGILVAALIWMMFFFEGINFTQTATLLAVAGSCAVLSVSKNNDIKTNIIRAVLAGAFFMISGSIRWKAMIMCIPFMMMTLGYELLINITSNKQIIKSLILLKQKIIVCTIVIFIAVTSYGLHMLYQVNDSDLKEWTLANGYREDIFDYKDRYPEYDGNEALYNQVGVDDSWLNMVFACYTSDKNYFSSEQLKKVVEFRENSAYGITDYISTLKSHADALLILILSIILLFTLFGIKKNLLPFILCLLSVMFSILFFIKMGRFPWRITNAFLFNAFVSGCIMTFCAADSETEKENTRSKVMKRVLVGTSVMIAVASILIRKEFSLPIPAANNKQDAIVLDYMNDNKQNVYFTKYNYYYIWNIWAHKHKNYLDNEFGMESNFIDGRAADKEKYGISDIVSQMLTQSNILTVYDDKWHSYLRSYYGDQVSAAIVDHVPGTEAAFVRYSVPKEADKTSEIKAYDFDITANTSEDNDDFELLKVSAQLTAAAYDDYYLNVIDKANDKVYTYPLISDQKNISGEIYRLKNTWNDNVDYQILGMRENDIFGIIIE